MFLRYHPMPPSVNPPLMPDTASGEKGDPVPGISSILKSCGRSTVRQELSSKPGCSALASPR